MRHSRYVQDPVWAVAVTLLQAGHSRSPQVKHSQKLFSPGVMKLITCTHIYFPLVTPFVFLFVASAPAIVVAFTEDSLAVALLKQMMLYRTPRSRRMQSLANVLPRSTAAGF
jgi:hypothetical protein